MTHEKALKIAHLIKHFGCCMTSDEGDARTHTQAFNDLFTAFLTEHPEENLTTIAAHITRAIDPPLNPQDPINTEVFARVLPDLLRVRHKCTGQDVSFPGLLGKKVS